MALTRRSKITPHPLRRKSSVFFRAGIILLVVAAVALSLLSVLLSTIAIQNDTLYFTNTLRGTIIEPHVKHTDAAIESTESEEGATENKNEIDEVSPATGEETAILTSQTHPILRDDVPKNEDRSLNSYKYQPVKNGKRLLTYNRFGGRLNNQLFQFITSLQHAKVLKRKFVVPNEVRDVEWTGMFETKIPLWDLEKLNTNYDIDWEMGLDAAFRLNTPDECILSPKDGKLLLEGGPKLWEEWDAKCPDVINLAGNTGLLFCGGQHQFCGDTEAQTEAYKIYSHIKLSDSLMQYIPSRRPEFKGKGFDEMAIHSRRAGEGGYDWSLCISGNTRTCRNHVGGQHMDKFCDVRTMKGNCAIWLDLDYQIKTEKFLKSSERDYKFVLASDGTHDWNIDFKGQFVAANNTDWLMAIENRVKNVAASDGVISDSIAVSAWMKGKLRGQTDLKNIWNSLDALSATLLDLFALVDSTYLLGAYYSTLSLNACYLRGMGRIYDSNMCWMLMHPGSKKATLPSLEATVHMHKPSDTNVLPPALMSDVEHAFVRSEDGQFIAIDRYLIHTRKKQLIGVLGDGTVPITFGKDGNGKETVHTDVRCSYGNQLDSPATIVLMKGHKTFQEHYNVQGDKYNTPFSTNGDRFRTMLIICEELKFNKNLSRHPPLTLQSPDGKFALTIGSTFAKPFGKVITAKTEAEDKSKLKTIHCLSPVYGLKDPRWIIEYLEYHKVIGIDHVHLYNIDMHSKEVQEVLQKYHDDGFVTRHDWSEKASGGYTTKKTYEHAKWAAQTDCVIRSRGVYDYALFSDIDEITLGVEPDGLLSNALAMCSEAKKMHQKIGCSFNSNTVSSIYTKLDGVEEDAMKNKLLLERYNAIEASPYCPANCECQGGKCINRKFHKGRQKYIVSLLLRLILSFFERLSQPNSR